MAYEWGRLIFWLGQDQHAAALQTIAAVSQVFFAVLAVTVAIYVPWKQQRNLALSEERRRANEVANIRSGLRDEVLLYSTQCLKELRDWQDGGQKKVRSANLPPLTIFEATASNIGLLSRKETASIIAFSGTLHDLRVVVKDIETNPRYAKYLAGQSEFSIAPDDRDSVIIVQIFSDQC